jgi:hypothetical protein
MASSSAFTICKCGFLIVDGVESTREQPAMSCRVRSPTTVGILSQFTTAIPKPGTPRKSEERLEPPWSYCWG